jgi:hypothetical protein
VNSAHFSPDGARIVTASNDHTARVWDAATGKTVGEPLRHEGIVDSAQFSPDGSLVVTAGCDKTAVWHAPGCPPPLPVPEWMHERVSALAGLRFSADGELLPVPREERITTLGKPIPGNDAWAVLGRWLVLPAAERTVTPQSHFTCRQVAERERDTPLGHRLRSALLYDPSVPLARLLLAGKLMREEVEEESRMTEARARNPDAPKYVFDPSLPLRVIFLRNYDLNRMPDDAGLWERAARALHEQQDVPRTRRALARLEKLDKDRASAVRKELGL